MPKKLSIVVTYCHPGMVSHGFMSSIIRLLQTPHDYELGLFNAYSGPLLSRARNQLASVFMANPDFTHMLMVDSDIMFEPDALDKLVAARKPIVGGLYFGMNTDNWKPFPTAMKVFEDEQYHPHDNLPQTGTVKVDAIGMGFTLIKREVVEAIGCDETRLLPFAETLIGDRAVGEDIAFCARAKEKGFQTWVSIDTRVYHFKSGYI